MNTPLETLFFKRLTILQLRWHEIVHEKLRLEDEIARYNDAAVLVKSGKDPCYALLTVDCHMEHRQNAFSDPGEVVRLHEQLKVLQAELKSGL